LKGDGKILEKHIKPNGFGTGFFVAEKENEGQVRAGVYKRRNVGSSLGERVGATLEWSPGKQSRRGDGLSMEERVYVHSDEELGVRTRVQKIAEK